jgi:hypothetical protein
VEVIVDVVMALVDVSEVNINGGSSGVLAGNVSVPIVVENFVTVNVAVVDADNNTDVSATVAVIVVTPLLMTFTSYSGRIENADTQFEDEPVSVKLPLKTPV